VPCLGPEADLRRREFLRGVGAATFPLAARAQPGERVRTIGFLHTQFGRTGFESPPRRIRAGLAGIGLDRGGDLKIAYRTGTESDVERIGRYAAELVGLTPDAIMVGGAANVGPLLQATSTVPIVFVNVADPVGAGTAWRARLSRRLRSRRTRPDRDRKRAVSGSLEAAHRAGRAAQV
jgi:putative tryptophan/tyrosine transport system substrate-binding protein